MINALDALVSRLGQTRVVRGQTKCVRGHDRRNQTPLRGGGCRECKRMRQLVAWKARTARIARGRYERRATELELSGVLGDAWAKYQRHAHRLLVSPETLRSYLGGTRAFLLWAVAQEKHDHAEVLSDELTASFAAHDYIKHLLKER